MNSKDSIAKYFPPEIILYIGQYLHGSSLISSLQVCRLWNQILLRYVWKSISKKQWHHPRFPLSKFKHIYPDRETNTMCSELSLLRHVEWWSNDALEMKTYMSYKQRRKLRPQLTFKGLSQLFKTASNLRSTSLHIYYLEDLSIVEPLINLILELGHLEKLDLTIWQHEAKDVPVPLENIYPLFQKLKELKLYGAWFNVKDKDQTLDKSSTHINQGSSRHSPPPHPSPQNNASMSVTTLAIHRLAMPLLRYCPNLRELSLRAPEENSIQTSLLPLLDFPNLEKLKVYDDSSPSSRNRTWTDLPQIIPALKRLKSLAICVFSLDHIRFLCAPPGCRGRHDDKDLPAPTTRDLNDSEQCLTLPLLEDLEIEPSGLRDDNPDDSREYGECLFNILKTRHLLKRLIVEGTFLNPDDVFAQPGMEKQDWWACRDLETLFIGVYVDIGNRAEQRERSKIVYRQIGELPKLKRLAIQGSGLQVCDGSGIDYLAPGGRSQLSEFMLLDPPTAEVWTKERICKLLKMMPNLEFLDVGNEFRDHEIKLWLKEMGRGDIKMTDWRRHLTW